MDYLGLAVLYYLAYIAAAVAAGVALFQTRGLEAQTASHAPGGVGVIAWTGRALAAAAAVAALLLLTTPRLWNAANLATGGGLLAGAVLGWWVFGGLGRGASWARWTTVALGAVLLAGGVGAIIARNFGAADLPATACGVASVAGVLVLVGLLLPRSRAHFRSS
jgi:hypothetical protein